MTIAAWQATHVYAAEDLVNPTVANGFTFRCVTGGTSGGTEPSWVGRYQNITDGSVTWVPYSIITPATVRAELAREGTTGQDSDAIIGGYILDAIDSLEHSTGRFLRNRPGYTVSQTSLGRDSMPLPGLRTLISITYAGALLTPSAAGGPWLLPDNMNTGVFTGVSFRPLRADGGPWWLSLGGATNNWFDTNADSPFDPRNYGGGYVYTSMPNDQVTVGDWGYEPMFEPPGVVHAVEVLSEWYVMRPPAILADSAITPAGGIVSYAQMPPEVQEFCKKWTTGRTVVSVG